MNNEGNMILAVSLMAALSLAVLTGTCIRRAGSHWSSYDFVGMLAACLCLVCLLMAGICALGLYGWML